MKAASRLSLLLLCLAALPVQAQAPKPAPPATVQPSVVGRLFFTPEQREQLDLLRLKKVVASQAKDEPPPEIITYEGIVRRADGQTTVWVNNKPLNERELRDAPAVAGRIERDGRLLLQAGQTGAGPALRLKVGQRAELSSGRVEERPATDTRNAIAEMRNGSQKPSGNSGSSQTKGSTNNPSPSKDSEKAAGLPPPAVLLEEAARLRSSDPEKAAILKELAEQGK